MPGPWCGKGEGREVGELVLSITRDRISDRPAEHRVDATRRDLAHLRRESKVRLDEPLLRYPR